MGLAQFDRASGSLGTEYTISRVIRKALSLVPEERYQTAEEFEKALIRDGESTERIRYLTIVLVFVCMGILFSLWEFIRIW